MDSKLKVCIVDDDDIYQFTANREVQYTKLAGKVSIFSNGAKAIQFFKTSADNKEELPDIIFLDINMPVMDGWQFLEQYEMIKHTMSKEILIYMVSSSIDSRDVARAKNNISVTDFIVKPVTKEKLITIFTNIME